MSMKMTMAEFVGLEPCPFCGGQAQMGMNKQSTVREYFVGCMNCHIRLYKIGYKRFWSETEAIAAWNTRSERTCYNVHGDDKYVNFICSECGLHMHKPNIGRSFVDENGKRWYGTSHEHALNYCPNCGCKVVGE